MPQKNRAGAEKLSTRKGGSILPRGKFLEKAPKEKSQLRINTCRASVTILDTAEFY